MDIVIDTTFNLLEKGIDYLFQREVISSMVDPLRVITINSPDQTVLSSESQGQVTST